MKDCETANHAWKKALETSASHSMLASGEEERYWEKYGEEYYRNRVSGPHYSDVLRFILAAIPQGADLLEVGPGPGVFTLPLSRHCRLVTAVEPSPANASLLRRKIASAGNVKVMETSWQEVEAARHDVVFGAGILYAFHDLESALRKMVRCALRKVVLVSVQDEQPLLREAATALHLPPPEPTGLSPRLIIDVLRNITDSFSCEKISGEQVYHYRNIHMLLDSWKHVMPLTSGMIAKLEVFLKEKGFAGEYSNTFNIPRRLSSYVIQVNTWTE